VCNCLCTGCCATDCTACCTACCTVYCTACPHSQLDSLVGQEVGRLLARSGLAEVVERVRLYQVRVDVSLRLCVCGVLHPQPAVCARKQQWRCSGDSTAAHNTPLFVHQK
jgi:hypothetical protein